MHLSKSAIALGLASVALGQKLKFMPLGDSITEYTCWRAKVWDQLVTGGLSNNIDFVGSTNTNPANCKATSGSFDLDHEGHSGFEATEIANLYIKDWAKAKPDIVNIHLGTNDISAGTSTSDIIGAIYTILLALRAENPNVAVIVDKIIPNPSHVEQTQALNAAIPVFVRTYTSEQSPMFTGDVSQEAGYKVEYNKADGVHPNDEGDKFIAGKIGPLLIKVIQYIS
ncbi:related to acetylxylan esterase [Cephalotrichum gorgonifer]|uniref:Related to acetylxylan esterase n=1 Tax=Cephalotrichum gorgonifer TaxID=2041049 RepID=A0AAE8N6Y0_9PEZI|nr:related to acetylxylan esterase [Cephalotrichum gorgonifer]